MKRTIIGAAALAVMLAGPAGAADGPPHPRCNQTWIGAEWKVQPTTGAVFYAWRRQSDIRRVVWIAPDVIRVYLVPPISPKSLYVMGEGPVRAFLRCLLGE